MMNISVGVLVLCLALCRASVPGFEDGKKYVYEYTSTYGSGVADNAVTQLAGQGIKAELYVYHTDNHLAVEMHGVKMAEFNKSLGSVFDVLDLDYKVPTDPKLEKLMAEYEKPLYGEYGTDGRFVASKHTALKDNPHTNLQRAILSLFQVIFPSDHADHPSYTVKESGVGGDCQTSYVINHFPVDSNENQQVLNITKVYNYDQCSYQPHSLFTFFAGHDCKKCKEEIEVYKEFINIGRVEYKMKGNKEEFTIEKIRATSYISFTPFTPNGQTAMSKTNQTFHLLRVEDFNPTAVPGDAKRIEGLYFQFHSDEHDYDKEDLKENHVFDRVYPKKYVQDRLVEVFGGEEDQAAQATSLLPKLFGFHDNPKSEPWIGFKDLAKITNLLTHVMFTFNYSDFQKFFDQNIKLEQSGTPKERDTRNYILKLLTFVGTNPSILFALDLIRTEKVLPALEVDMISTLPFYAKTPSRPLLEEFRKFVKSTYVNADHDKDLFVVAWEAYGTLIFKACVKNECNDHPARKDTFVDKEHCKEYVKDIIDNLKGADRWQDKSMYTGALKNTRSEEAYRYLMDELIPATGHKYNEHIRDTANLGLELFVDNDKRDKEITAALMPIFTDTNEDYQLRIYAFDVLLYIHQQPRFYRNLVEFANDEPNSHVARYVRSTLSSIANTTDICYQHVAKHARSILPYIIPKDNDYDFLKNSSNNKQDRFGRSTQFTVIGGNDTAIPREVYFRQAVNLDRGTFDFLEIGSIQRNDRAVDNILIASMQKMGTKASEGMSSEIHSRIFNQLTPIVFKLNSPENRAYIKRAITDIGEHKINVHSINVVLADHFEDVVPNMMGLPVYHLLFSSVIERLDGELVYTDDMNSNLLKVAKDFQYSIELDVQAKILVDNPFLGASGYQLQIDAGFKLPLHGEHALDVQQREIKTKRFGHGLMLNFTYDYNWNNYN